MPKRSVMKPGMRRLSEVARHVVMPDGIALSGWGDVRNQCSALGIAFEGWQDGIGRIAFSKRSDGVYAASVGGICMSIPRQTGKTFLVGAIAFAVCLLTPRSKVIWTAHHSNTADETLESMAAMAQMRKIAPHVRAVRTANGQQRIVFKNGSRIEFGAREHGFGRGKQKVSFLVLDEAQHMSESALENIVPSMNRADNPLMFMMGTPPRPEDKGDMFSNKRRRALSGESKNMAYVEFSADADAKLDDRKQWAKANPSYPHFTNEEAMLRMRETFGDGGFKREALGLWVDDSGGTRAVPADLWEATVGEPAEDGLLSYAVAFDMDGDYVSLAGAQNHGDGVHVEEIAISEADQGLERGLSNLADWFCEKGSDGIPRWRSSAGIAISGRAGTPALAQLLRDRRVPERWIFLPSRAKYLEACSMWLDGVRGEAVTHKADGQERLDASVAVTDVDKRGGLSATTDDGDETPVEAVALAHWVARTSVLNRRRADGDERKAVFL